MKYLPRGFLLGVLSEFSLLPILMQKKIGGIVSKRQIDAFKFKIEGYYSKAIAAARNKIIDEIKIKHINGKLADKEIKDYEFK